MNTELTAYYKNLLILQYRDKVKAQGHIGAIVDAGMIYDIMIAVRDGFDLETAIGAQLDVLGRILGVSRTITGTTFTRAYYGYMLYGDTAPFVFNPMLLYGAEVPDVQFRDYRESTQSLYDLTDEEYRVILKLAIVRNNSNASVKTIDEILNNLFGAECYFIDRMNMTVVSYMVGAKWSRIFTIAKASGLLPNPAGVGTALVVVPDINNIFSYSLYGGAKPDFAKGYINYWGIFEAVGSPITLSGSGYSSISALSSSRIAFISTADKTLHVYDFDNSAWIEIGNPFLISGSLVSSITALSSTRIALVDESDHKLKTYDFDGTSWSLVGNGLFIYGVSRASISALSSSRIAFIDQYNHELRTFEFDGTDWTNIGSVYGTNISAISFPEITALSSTRIALVDTLNRNLVTYDFNGTNWIQEGSSLFIDGTNYINITTLSSSRISLANQGLKIIQNYEFDGYGWYEIGEPKIFDNMGYPSITSFSSEEIVFLNGYDQRLQTYDLIKEIIGCMASYS